MNLIFNDIEIGNAINFNFLFSVLIIYTMNCFKQV